jgi:hypothetical protein
VLAGDERRARTADLGRGGGQRKSRVGDIDDRRLEAFPDAGERDAVAPIIFF